MMKLVTPPKKKSTAVGVLKGGMDSWIQVEMRQCYEDKRPLWSEPRPVSKGWRPSGLAEPNDRLLVAGQLGYRGDLISERLQRIFDAGNDIEDRWVKRFGEMGVLVDHNVWIPRNTIPGLVVSGKIDIIVKHPYEDGRKFVVEVKSISPEGFGQLPKSSVNGDVNYANLLSIRGNIGERLRKYLIQLQLYLISTKCDEGILLMDNKGNQDYRDYYITARPEDLVPVEQRLMWLEKEYWSKHLLPPWAGSSRAKHIMATYKPKEVVPLAEMKEAMGEEEEDVTVTEEF